MDKSKSKIFQNQQIKRYLFLLAIILILIVVFSFLAPGFFSVRTFFNIIRQNTSLAILSLGITFIIMLAGTDLSSGANIALAGACGAIVMQSLGGEGLGTALCGFLVCIIVGIAAGSANGLMVGGLGISPFMATLAMTSVSRGLTIYLTNSKRVVVRNDYFNWFGQKNIFGSFPASLLYLAVLFVIMYLVLNKTTFGRKTFAVGGNAVTSRASGIKVIKHTVIVYLLGGLFAGFASVVTVGRALSAQPLAGQNMEFDAITAVVIGGTSLMGGTGSLVGTMLGVVIIGTIFTGLGMMPISPYYSYVVKGLLIVVSVYMDQYSSKERVKVSSKDKKAQKEAAAAEVHSRHKNDISIEEAKELELRGIVKEFPGVKALDGVNLKVKRGTVHALMGENGAGKSTLIKILSGVYKKDGGEIYIDGKPVSIHSPMDSQKLGISVIYQEFALVPELSITQNIFLGKEMKGTGPIVNRKDMEKKARALIGRFNLNISENKKVGDCTVGQQQMIEIAKAIGSNSWVIVMDEPTSAITEAEKEKLFEIIQELKEQGMAIIYISHRMSEIFEIADEITVLRDGKYVMSSPVSEVTEDMIIKSMVGRELSDVFSREKFEPGDVVLEVKDLYRKGVFEPISFTVRKGEVLGFSGLMGAGRTEIARCIFGLDKPDGGEIYLNGKKLDIRNPFDAIKSGIAYVSEDRRREGIVPLLSIRENMTLASLPWVSKATWIDGKQETSIAEEYIDALSIKTPSMDQKIGKLSGGNQQKVCLGKWLCRNPQIIILDEPTRGIDVGAKAEIHKIIENLCRNGIAVIMISSEMPEVLGSSDKIIVLYEGRKTGEFDCVKDLTQDEIMIAASGESGSGEVA